jgi:hypothetical protein
MPAMPIVLTKTLMIRYAEMTIKMPITTPVIIFLAPPVFSGLPRASMNIIPAHAIMIGDTIQITTAIKK